ncbi:TonB-dependent siderophore receptor [Calidifontimicrobium sp. SYSU G02091]|uniref:TonB-dependent receptor n=1 Tax=Calidifontimicrobium sp. SYSU G02091 TaxID=2926421 RepID=UPI001F53B78A|nr:TonB-dependent siderophore receptor [Calidifontimicrobium sp. SYSU G02091]MCI1190351.1 TonB-dependent siderophore receptor [Calidifontimicrobium sp. SYSU G02091]
MSRKRAHCPRQRRARAAAASARPRALLPLGALAAGFGLAGHALAQTAPAAPAEPPAETVMPVVRASASAEPTGKQTLQATTTSIGKGRQDLRDIPQSVTVVTERLIDDRNLDSLKEALRNTAGISFQAAEGAEEDIRLRGFSLQSTGDLFVDGIRDPAFYERDTFNFDRIEVLRGSASMLFGRGSTGGAVNQVSKLPRLIDEHEVAVTVDSAGTVRSTGDFNVKTGPDAALRINAMLHGGGDGADRTDKKGIAPTYRWGIGLADEFTLGYYRLENDNGVHYGLPYLVPFTGATTRKLWPNHGDDYYGMASDYSASTVDMGTFSHTHRFADRSELKTTLRVAHYERDLRASAIRFAAASLQPGGQAVTAATFGPGTVLTRGTNNKVQDLKTAYLQSDYSGKFQALGLRHELLAGVDLAKEDFRNYATTLPTGVTLTKPRTTVGTPDDGAWIDESLRVTSVNRTFEARGLGVYAQDLVQVAPDWKVLAGLRWDRFEGDYLAVTGTGNPATNPCAVAAGTRLERRDSLWSKRFGVLYQPSPYQSYHASYGTSFNTSGDTYQFDAGTAKTPPESSRNIELGGKLDFAEGRYTARFALFHSTKYNERNRDADSVDACNYVLSGKRHAAGVEFDVAGRLTPAWEVFASYAWIPVARVDASSGAAGTEPEGSRPGLTPKHTGTVWTTYRLAQKWRVGAGLNGASADTPVGLATPFKVPAWVTADLMAEYAWAGLTARLYVANVTDRHYADQLYRGHYIPGKPRTVSVTLAAQF